MTDRTLEGWGPSRIQQRAEARQSVVCNSKPFGGSILVLETGGDALHAAVWLAAYPSVEDSDTTAAAAAAGGGGGAAAAGGHHHDVNYRPVTHYEAIHRH